MTPLFLGIEDILEIHRDQIERYGGTIGVRDEGLLRSAISMPCAGMGGEFFHPTLHEMAAAYLFHLVQNHPFLDGNKRVAAAAAFVFLHINDVELVADEESFEDLVRGAASGQIGKIAIAEFLRTRCRPLSRPPSERDE